MKSVEDRLKEVHAPDVHVESHRTQLGYRLMRPVPARVPLYRRRALALGMLAMVLLGGLTAVHPSWAKDIIHLVLIRESKVTTQDGHKATVRTYQTDAPPGGGTTHVTVNGDGSVSATQTSGTDPALEAMHTEAEAQVRSGQAVQFLVQDGMRFYRVTLRDGRHITYTAGPGTSWSISTGQ
ncbi:MAG TPA: hypothetical protein VGL38_01715 [bacterium]|jgi:hypothetical protein